MQNRGGLQGKGFERVKARSDENLTVIKQKTVQEETSDEDRICSV
jgi:hypothetical protein